MARRCKICLADDDAAAVDGDMTFDFCWLAYFSSISRPLNRFIDNKEALQHPFSLT